MDKGVETSKAIEEQTAEVIDITPTKKRKLIECVHLRHSRHLISSPFSHTRLVVRVPVGKWPAHFINVVECYTEVKDLLTTRPQILLPDGKIGWESRDIGFFSDDSAGYRYTQEHKSVHKLTANLKTLLQQVNEALGTQYNGILFNRYANGRDSCIGPHRIENRNQSPPASFSVTVFPDCLAPRLGPSPSRIFRIHADPTKLVRISFNHSQ